MKSVRLTKRHAVMKSWSQDPLNPHPVFPPWSPWSVYPYLYWGSMSRRVVKRRYYMPTLENDYLRVTIAPDIGGRIWDIYDKIGGRHVVNYDSGVISYNAGMGLNYTSGGIECNYPIAHSCTTSRPREVSTARYPDGSAAIIISEYDQVWRTRWASSYILYPARSFVEVRVRIYNRTPHDSRYMFWNNCGFPVRDTTQFIFPEQAGAVHGAEANTFSWPRWRHSDLSVWGNGPEALGLYMLDASEPYFGCYDPEDGYGLVHYADLADLPGKKYWSWGTDRREWYTRTHSTEARNYGEVQSGRIVIQEHLDRVPPETECEWSGFWFPVRDTGAFNGAGPGAALRVALEERGRETRLTVTAMGNGTFPGARVRLESDGIPPVERAMPLDPVQKTTRSLILRGKAGPERHTRVTVTSEDGRILAVWRAKPPRTRDSWREVITLPASDKTEPVGVESLFLAAEAKARDWGNHNLTRHYEKCLRLDEGYVPARLELGKLAVLRRQFEEAIDHFRTALARSPDSLEAWYGLGLALRRAGRVAEARKAFELANRYGHEARALARLAELCMGESDWHHALKHLDRLAAAAPRLTRPRGLRAVCLRKLGRRREAAREIGQALAVDGQDPFLQMECVFIREGVSRKPGGRAVSNLIEQVRGYEPPLLEAACDYLGVGLYRESAAVLRTIPRPGPLATFLLAYLAEKCGRAAEAGRILDRACRLDPTGHCLWRLEMAEVMEWAMTRRPKAARPLLHMGNFLMAKRRADEAVALWRRAEQLGERHFLLYASLGFYESRAAKNPGKAREYFAKAVKAAPDEPHTVMEYCGTIPSAERRRYLERNRELVRRSPKLAHRLLQIYLRAGDYGKFDALCAELDFSENWQLAGPHSLWADRHVKEALELARDGKALEAYERLLALKQVPRRLGDFDYDGDQDERRLYHLGCLCERLGRDAEAREWWERAAAVPHVCAWEPAYWFKAWRARYFQALALRKLGREAQAQALIDAMELLAANPQLSANGRKAVLELVERARFAPEEEKDPQGAAVEVATKAEL
ncbi:MAG: DUF5107 domain-containing protein [Kiritimatiellae bacterium]|nr:DUF5107 domain-containing protein [Kiritimatiellia bacterium]